MMLVILLGIISSTVTEIVTALNKRLSGTVLKGDAAFLIAFAMALIGAFVKEVTMPGFDWSVLAHWQSLVTTFGEVFTVSQLYFIFITQKLNLDVQPSPVVPSIDNAGAGSGDKIVG